MRTVSIAVVTLLLAGCSPRQPRDAAPTFNRDIAPIVFTHCAPCHRPGQPVPFTLTTYAEVKARAAVIAQATEQRRMPPWLPDQTGPPLMGERRLGDDDIDLIRRWVSAGAVEGTSAPPPLPSWPGEWQLGAPDLIVTLPRPFVLQPGGHDVYRNVILPVPLTTDRFVRAIEFRPGSAAVHHAVIRVDRTRQSRARDGTDGQPGFDGMVAYDVQDPDGHFLGWAPGRGPIVAPEGMPWTLDRQSDLIVELHLMPGSEAASVQPSVGVFFTETPPAKSPVMIVMGSKRIDIPAGDAAYTIEDRYQLPIDAELLSLYPHAHYLGRDMVVRAMFPDGGERTLLHIPRWNFRWQQDYRFQTPLALPRGTTLALRYQYDNSASNPNNPHRPPRRVLIGPQSSDEMGNLGVQLLPRSRADAATLVSSFAEHALQIDLGAAAMLVEEQPDHGAHHVLLGTTLARLGRFTEAIAHLERGLDLGPPSAQAENYLGGALTAVGRAREALTHFRRAARLSPDDEHLRYNLAKALEGEGRADEAARAYGDAIRLNPAFPEAHHQLGALLFAGRRLDAAIEHLRRAAELAPDSADIHSDLGGALAQAGRYEEARAEFRRALDLDPAHAAARDNLARLPVR